MLYVVGAGIRGVCQLTLQAVSYIEASDVVLSLGTVDGLSKFLRERSLYHIDLTSNYSDGGLDSDNYSRILSEIRSNLDKVKIGTLIVPGDPRFGVTIVQTLTEAPPTGHALIVEPGISSFSTMINDIAVDPLERGSVLIDVNRFLLYDYQTDPCLDHYIYHVSSILNPYTDWSDPSKRNNVYFLLEKLSRHFPATHQVTLLQSATRPDLASSRNSASLSELPQLLASVNFFSSLYIRGLLPKRSQVNEVVLAKIREQLATQ